MTNNLSNSGSSLLWRNEQVLEFIELYKNEPVIWDPKHPHYRNRTSVSEGWLRIRSLFSLNCPVEILKKKKESLMTSYRTIKRKQKMIRDFPVSWFAFDLMDSFLGKFYSEETNNSENGSDLNDSNDVSQYLQFMQYASCDDDTKETKKIPIKEKEHSSHTISMKESPRRTKRRSYENEKSCSKIYLRTEERSDSELDELDLYIQLLKKKLRKIDHHQREIAMHEIDKVVFRAQMESLQRNRRLSSSASPERLQTESPVFIIAQDDEEQYDEEHLEDQFEEEDPMDENSL